jgi:hypothetical protein
MKNRINLKLIISLIIVTLLVYINDLGIYSIPPIIFITSIVIIAIILPLKELFQFFFFMIPFMCSMHGGVFLPILISFVLKSKKYNVYQLLFPFIIIIIELLHLISYQFKVDFGIFGMYSIVILLFFVFLFRDNITNEEIKKSIKLYIIGTILVSISIVVIAVITYSFIDIFIGVYRIGGDTDSDIKIGYTKMNANTLAYFVITAFSLLLYTKDLFNNKIIKILLLTILTILGILSASRTFILLFGLLLVFYFLSSHRFKERIYFIIISASLIVSAYLIFPTYVDSFIERYTKRFEETDLTGGRNNLFKDYNEFMLDNPDRLIYGTGAVHYKVVCKQSNSIHNGTQQIYVCYGIIGVIIFIFVIIIFKCRYIKYLSRIRIRNYIPFFTCFLFDQSIQFLIPYVLMLPFLVSVLPLRLKNDIQIVQKA